MPETWTFHSAGQIILGRNAVLRLGEVAEQLNIKRLFIVTDSILVQAGLVDRVRTPLTERGMVLEVFDGGEAEPSLRAAEACISHGRRFQPDALLGLGGGSNMDLAKITATVLAHGGPPRASVREINIPRPIFPVALVPTSC